MATISLKNTVDEYFGNNERYVGIGGGGGGAAAGVAIGAGAAALFGALTKEEREKLTEEKGKKWMDQLMGALLSRSTRTNSSG